MNKVNNTKNNKKKRLSVVIIMPYRREDKKILIIEEFRKDFGIKMWKLISGGMDKENLTTLETAKEEMAEEVSMESEKWYKFHENEKIFNKTEITYFIAENPNKMKNPPENPDLDDFIIGEKWVNLEQLWEMIDKKEIFWNDSVFVAINFLREKNNLKKS